MTHISSKYKTEEFKKYLEGIYYHNLDETVEPPKDLISYEEWDKLDEYYVIKLAQHLSARDFIDLCKYTFQLSLDEFSRDDIAVGILEQIMQWVACEEYAAKVPFEEDYILKYSSEEREEMMDFLRGIEQSIDDEGLKFEVRYMYKMVTG